MTISALSRCIALVMVGLGLVLAAQAQPTSGGPTSASPTVGPTETPLDGGVSLLLVAGVGLAARKLRQRRQQP